MTHVPFSIRRIYVKAMSVPFGRRMLAAAAKSFSSEEMRRDRHGR
jgi:hypothetical protein